METLCLTNKSADGVIFLRNVADLAPEGLLQRRGQSRVAPLCQRLVELAADLRTDAL